MAAEIRVQARKYNDGEHRFTAQILRTRKQKEIKLSKRRAGIPKNAGPAKEKSGGLFNQIPQLWNDELGGTAREVVVDGFCAGHGGAGGRFLCGTADVGSHQNVLHVEEGVVQVEGLLLHGVQAGPGNFLGLQGTE